MTLRPRACRRQGFPSIPHQSLSAGDRQFAPAHATPLHDDNALCNLGSIEGMQYFAHASDNICFAPDAIAEQDQARCRSLSQREQTWIIEIHRDHRPPLLLRAGQNLDIGRAGETQLSRVRGIVSLFPEPYRQNGDSGMSTRKATPQLAGVSSIVSSSAKKAAYRKASSMSADSR